MIRKRIFLLLLMMFILLSPVAAAAEGRNIIRFGDDVTVEEGMKVNHVIAVGGQVTVYGVADGNVVSVGDSVVLASSAIVGGNVISIGGVIARGGGSEGMMIQFSHWQQAHLFHPSRSPRQRPLWQACCRESGSFHRLQQKQQRL